MHELSICRRIVDAALEEFDRLDPRPARIVSARVVVGRLHQIIPDFLISAFELLTRETAASGASMELVTAPVTGRCGACGHETEIDPPIFRCRDCGSHDLELSGGKELYLDRLEVEWHDDSVERGGFQDDNAAT